MEEAASPETRAGLQDELRYLLHRWDPIGVCDESSGFPSDEYDCLLGPLLVRLARHASRADPCEYLWYEVRTTWDLTLGGEGRCSVRR